MGSETIHFKNVTRSTGTTHEYLGRDDHFVFRWNFYFYFGGDLALLGTYVSAIDFDNAEKPTISSFKRAGSDEVAMRPHDADLEPWLISQVSAALLASKNN